jgi:integrase
MEHDETQKARQHRAQKDSSPVSGRLGEAQGGTKKVHSRCIASSERRFAKSDVRHWRSRVYKPVSSAGAESTHFAIQIQHGGERQTISLRTGNADIAAARARDIYQDVVVHTWKKAPALLKLRPKKPVTGLTIGEYLDAAGKVMAVRPATLAAYGVHLRRIAGDILAARTARKAKLKKKREARKVIEAAPLTLFTPEAVQAWRLAFVARAGADGSKARAARISCNSILRQARSLFGKKVVKLLKSLQLPDPLPFAGVEFYKRESMRYTSKIDAGELLRKAQTDLATSEPEAFLVILLALAAGLRRGEIDRLFWRQVDFDGGRVIVEESEAGSLKSEESRGAVPVDPRTVEILRGFHAKAQGQFVIESTAGAGEASRSWGMRYRCQAVFLRVNGWLRANGIEGNKALHTLRKEAGAIIVTQSGIYAASKFLRHADISITAAHYADHKERVTVDIGALLPPENVVSIDRGTEQGSESSKSASPLA